MTAWARTYIKSQNVRDQEESKLKKKCVVQIAIKIDNDANYELAIAYTQKPNPKLQVHRIQEIDKT